MKGYADRARNAEENSLVAGDKVFFESQPYELIDKCGNSVLVESPEGTQ